jgi:hypothetical protein
MAGPPPRRRSSPIAGIEQTEADALKYRYE